MGSEKLVLKGTGLTSTLRCTLKCKLCCTFSPYYHPPKHFDYNFLAETVDRYFKVVDSVGKFTISGGEPFIHEDLDKVITKISEYFNRIGVLEIITNGTVKPSGKLLDVLEKYKDNVSLMIDEYGHLSDKVGLISTLLQERGVDFRIRNYGPDNPHCGGWVDFGDFSLKHGTKKEVEEKFSKCAYPRKLQFCFSIMDGEIHPCTPSRRCMELGIIPKDPDEYVDLFDDSISIEEQRQKIRKILYSKSLAACGYCNGICDDSVRYIPAEQLKD